MDDVFQKPAILKETMAGFAFPAPPLSIAMLAAYAWRNRAKIVGYVLNRALLTAAFKAPPVSLLAATSFYWGRRAKCLFVERFFTRLRILKKDRYHKAWQHLLFTPSAPDAIKRVVLLYQKTKRPFFGSQKQAGPFGR